MVKTRILPESNYKSIYNNGKTLRIALDSSKPILELKYPEFYDVKLTDKCNGMCPECYQNSIPQGKHSFDALKKIKDFFGKLSENNKPFQVALGGGEPTLHPDFIEILKTFHNLGITPNYTTNGMNLTEKILRATKKYCGGVAVSCHEHLNWREAVYKLTEKGIKTNLHIIISDKQSIKDFEDIYNQFHRRIEYFVLLPYIAMGRAKKKRVQFKELTKVLDKIKSDQIAFGANFYKNLKTTKKYDVSLYEPELMSKYLDLTNMKIYKSSFNLG
jgi:uncharacterized radical SAM superfamily Fe-S cluster-containing enzyme